MLRRSACVLVVCAMFAACDSASSTTQQADAAAPTNADASSVSCPTDDPPAEGDPCSFPESTTCDFGACATKLARCTGGHWRYGGNPPPNPPCPVQVPPPMTACPECWPAEGQCTYHEADCFSGDASNQQIIVASCAAQVWTFTFRPCPVPDAGADVQGDAEPDGD